MMKMMNIIVGVLLLIGYGVLFPVNECTCNKIESWEKTYRGDIFPPDVEKKSFKLIHGVAQDGNGDPLSGILVEVFDNPENRLSPDYGITAPKNSKQKRLAACKTGKDGEFCFVGIPKGKYELRFSDEKELFANHSIIMKIDPGSWRGSKKKLKVSMTLNH